MATCRLCDSTLDVLDIYENFPVGSELVSLSNKDIKPGKDLSICVCCSCGHVQLKDNFDYSYYQNYQYSSSENFSKSSIDLVLDKIKGYLSDSQGTIIELGCNDFYLLSQLPEFKTRIGIDPSVVSSNKHRTVGSVGSENKIHFINEIAENVSSEIWGRADIVVSQHNLEHINDLTKVISHISSSVKLGTLFVVEVPDGLRMLEGLRLYQLFHEHIHYFTRQTLIKLMKAHGFDLVEVSSTSRYGGSLLGVFVRSSRTKNANLEVSGNDNQFVKYYGRAKDMYTSRMRVLREKLEETYGKNVCYGAGHALPAVAYHLDGSLHLFDSLFDDDNKKHGLRYATTAVSISNPPEVMEGSQVLISSPDHVLAIEEKVWEKGGITLRLL